MTMIREVRTKITDTDEAMDAAFVMISGVIADPSCFDPELNGATLRPMERVERRSDDEARKAEITLSFEVTKAVEDDETKLPEMERILVPG